MKITNSNKNYPIQDKKCITFANVKTKLAQRWFNY